MSQCEFLVLINRLCKMLTLEKSRYAWNEYCKNFCECYANLNLKQNLDVYGKISDFDC